MQLILLKFLKKNSEISNRIWSCQILLMLVFSPRKEMLSHNPEIEFNCPSTIIIIIIVAVVAISIGLYTILPLFTNTVVDEPLPTASGMSIASLLQETSIHY
jgi:hypothetical protein